MIGFPRNHVGLPKGNHAAMAPLGAPHPATDVTDATLGGTGTGPWSGTSKHRGV